jgi:hypothetical protein
MAERALITVLALTAGKQVAGFCGWKSFAFAALASLAPLAACKLLALAVKVVAVGFAVAGLAALMAHLVTFFRRHRIHGTRRGAQCVRGAKG